MFAFFKKKKYKLCCCFFHGFEISGNINMNASSKSGIFSSLAKAKIDIVAKLLWDVSKDQIFIIEASKIFIDDIQVKEKQRWVMGIIHILVTEEGQEQRRMSSEIGDQISIHMWYLHKKIDSFYFYIVGRSQKNSGFLNQLTWRELI